MPVFISYQHKDRQTARAVHSRLQDGWGIKTYLDELDQALQDDHAQVTRILLDRLARCSHLLALISRSTVQSWWVPFEIGVATKGEGRIASYGIDWNSLAELPDYLKMWPILRSTADVEKFAQRYQQDRVVLEKSQRYSEARSTTIQSAADFHRLLKADLRQ